MVHICASQNVLYVHDPANIFLLATVHTNKCMHGLSFANVNFPFIRVVVRAALWLRQHGPIG